MENNLEMISRNIKKIREDNNLSQDEFAASINLRRNSITLMENGKRNASDRTIKDICKHYNISENWIRTGEGEMIEAIDEDTQYAEAITDIFKEKDSFRRKMYMTLRELDDTSWEVLQKFLQELVKE